MVSIIIPTFNEEEYLPRLLASIRSQRFADIEIIVADAKSNDRTCAISAQFGAKVVEGGMPGRGRNLGAAAASGDLFLFLDADVVLPDTDWLSRKIEQFARRKLDAGTCLIRPMRAKLVDHVAHDVFNAHMLATQLIKPHAPGFCIFAKRGIHEAIDGFDESITLAEDHDYVLRAGRVGKFRVMHGPGINVSIRRFERDGRFAIYKKFLLAELHLLTLGQIRHEGFHYTFGYEKDVRPKDPLRKGF